MIHKLFFLLALCTTLVAQQKHYLPYTITNGKHYVMLQRKGSHYTFCDAAPTKTSWYLSSLDNHIVMATQLDVTPSGDATSLWLELDDLLALINSSLAQATPVTNPTLKLTRQEIDPYLIIMISNGESYSNWSKIDYALSCPPFEDLNDPTDLHHDRFTQSGIVHQLTCWQQDGKLSIPLLSGTPEDLIYFPKGLKHGSTWQTIMLNSSPKYFIRCTATWSEMLHLHRLMRDKTIDEYNKVAEHKFAFPKVILPFFLSSTKGVKNYLNIAIFPLAPGYTLGQYICGLYNQIFTMKQVQEVFFASGHALAIFHKHFSTPQGLTLLHGDPSLDNIIVDSSRKVYFIDNATMSRSLYEKKPATNDFSSFCWLAIHYYFSDLSTPSQTLLAMNCALYNFIVGYLNGVGAKMYSLTLKTALEVIDNLSKYYPRHKNALTKLKKDVIDFSKTRKALQHTELRV